MKQGDAFALRIKRDDDCNIVFLSAREKLILPNERRFIGSGWAVAPCSENKIFEFKTSFLGGKMVWSEESEVGVFITNKTNEPVIIERSSVICKLYVFEKVIDRKQGRKRKRVTETDCSKTGKLQNCLLSKITFTKTRSDALLPEQNYDRFNILRGNINLPMNSGVLLDSHITFNKIPENCRMRFFTSGGVELENQKQVGAGESLKVLVQNDTDIPITIVRPMIIGYACLYKRIVAPQVQNIDYFIDDVDNTEQAVEMITNDPCCSKTLYRH